MEKVFINNQVIDNIVSFTMKRNYKEIDVVYIDLILKKLPDNCQYSKNELVIIIDEEIIIATDCTNINWNYDDEKYYIEFLVKNQDIVIYKNISLRKDYNEN